MPTKSPRASKTPAKTRKTNSDSAANLVIVESPAKAKTIEKYLGEGYRVVSCYGHVRDLPKNNKAIDIQNGFAPTYVVSDDKKDVIKELKSLAKKASLVYLASDDDREGEAISWHLKESLNLKDEAVRRIVFHEITKNAILKAIDNPRTINTHLVNAQQARRILDRLVGFELSPILWRKIKTGLSAGRVQSVAVRMVVEREREIEQFQSQSAFRVVALLEVEPGKTLKAELNKRFADLASARAFLEKCREAAFTISDLQVKEGKRSPAPPFTTSTLQQEASRRLNFSVAQTMQLAQRLYEAGKITYMRTDSLNLSEEAIQRAASRIKSEYGPEYAQTRQYKTKNQSAQEAHEAIRPTDFAVESTGTDRAEKALYEMIWKRSIASQMSDARIEKTTASIAISGVPDEKLVATGEVIKFEGFLKVYLESSDDEDSEESKMLPPLKKGQLLALESMQARQTFSKPPARYTEASLVKQLEEQGIGRPSTYAPTISTIQKRDYVIKETREGKERIYSELLLKAGKITESQKTEIYGSEKSKLFPTSIGKVVTDFLVEYFDNVIDYSFTASVEKEFDDISRGNKNWNDMIARFYFDDFHPKVEKTQDVDRSQVGTVRELGVDPKSGQKVIARLGRFGPLVQIGETTEEGTKPRFASLERDQFLDTITLEQALDLFKLPQTVGSFEDQELIVGKGRFGPYIKHGDKFVSIPKGEDPLSITQERATELVLAKRKADAEKFIKGFDQDPDIQVLNGRWGPYLKAHGENYKIPKDLVAADLSYEQCLKLVAEAPPKKPRKGAPVAKASAKTAAKTTAKKAPAKKVATGKAKTATKTPAKKTASKTASKLDLKTTKEAVKKSVSKKSSAKTTPKTK
ncbi:type I DNA topoisomerase [bacterium (Candidatus Blackallbacteria) CG17_big_fil_post_rev_8_21_14_2_50_48_46]|uniref:DNA topoisomerase 1 n=1 Tax=bacterium (Candidatus Blackallbacteria) CG17_big_fil_post_rev_8_21_14_2_50_48_46 TaxID=2014261 RepID=A0A2M7G968_9BACT|nr:MAG: DNA topoisomerase I [bacterium (Candidatus Blackallbacteria) CG18_big_fil_WC_8_21_14_2_50_49_26]PIW18645.1 MAG: type I DNA topoisomerase [bacterium (Candidatus Blackallbacteria) CG17_big_fil_post_rev_8_21_14_2_50_48_46]PIW46369.1 MAG: type I DNA topoisomerase [bacterium (Candidatus Blackallbacteria) CG13_big_fil_rev_8_21_14_2_50_49_14]